MEETTIVKRESRGLTARNRWNALLESFFSGRSQKTVIAYRKDLEDFRDFLNADTLDKAKDILLGQGHGEANALALQYKADLIRRGFQPATINRRLAALRSLVKLARTLGLIPWILEVQNMKTESYRDTRGPGKEGFQRMLEIAKGQKKEKAARDVLILRLLHDMGLRRGEVQHLDIEDVDLERNTIAILGKGRTQKELLSVPEPTKEALENWLEIRNETAGPLFTNFDRRGIPGRLTATSLYRIVRDLGKLAGLKTRPHGLRHLAITTACEKAQENGFVLEDVMDFSRHRDVKTLMIYRDKVENRQGKIAGLVAATV